MARQPIDLNEVDQDFVELIRLTSKDPEALPVEDLVEFGELLYRLFGSVERVRDLVEAVTGEEYSILRYRNLDTEPGIEIVM